MIINISMRKMHYAQTTFRLWALCSSFRESRTKPGEGVWQQKSIEMFEHSSNDKKPTMTKKTSHHHKDISRLEILGYDDQKGLHMMPKHFIWPNTPTHYDQMYLPTMTKYAKWQNIHTTTKKTSHYQKDPATIAKNATTDNTNSPNMTNQIT